jgi:hypothetical protein
MAGAISRASLADASFANDMLPLDRLMLAASLCQGDAESQPRISAKR